jgi:hypothetical protein
MASLLDYSPALAIGAQAYSLTGNSTDSVTATGYAAFIQSITGESPTIISLGNNKAQILLSQTQISKMQSWLDTKVTSLVHLTSDESNLDLNIGSFLGFWSLKYAIPAALVFVLMGWFAHHYLVKYL